MSGGILVGMFGQVGSCSIGSFVSLVKFEILRDAKYGMAGDVPTMLCCG
jgi:hypothetical protein